MPAKAVLGLLIFAVTYGLISARRLSWLPLDRPAGALLGAVACVALGVLSPAQALQAVDGATLLLLLGMMGMGAVLAADGLFDHLESALCRWAVTPTRLLGVLVWGSGVLSALITNDAVCVLGAPLVVRLIQRHRLPAPPLLLALATAANTGSVATLVGNPQNMLCATLGGLEYGTYLARMLPVALLGLAVNHGLLLAMFGRSLRAATLSAASVAPPLPTGALVSLAVITATAVAYVLGANLPWTAAAGFTLLMVLRRRDPAALWARIDWSVLLFFAGLFVVVEALVQTGVPAQLLARHPLHGGESSLGGALRLSAIFLVGSNVVSNVPFILVVREAMAQLGDPRAGWELLAMASTFAGNLTLLGSVANIIVAETGREVGGLGFVEHLKVGLPLALATTLLGAAWLAWL